MKQKVRIENWYIDGNDILCGDVYGHSSLLDGASIKTGNLVMLNKNSCKAETSNTIYDLGKELRVDKNLTCDSSVFHAEIK